MTIDNVQRAQFLVDKNHTIGCLTLCFYDHVCNNDLLVSVIGMIMLAAVCFAAFLVAVFAQVHFFDYVSFCFDWVVIAAKFDLILFVCDSHMI